jgi:hypothetical protein
MFRIENTKKRRTKDDKDEETEPELDTSRHIERSEINLQLKPVKIYLSMESVKPLFQFFKSFSAVEKPSYDLKDGEVQNEDSISVDEFQNLMECISHNPSGNLDEKFER